MLTATGTVNIGVWLKAVGIHQNTQNVYEHIGNISAKYLKAGMFSKTDSMLSVKWPI